jgi:hypothetical protein
MNPTKKELLKAAHEAKLLAALRDRVITRDLPVILPPGTSVHVGLPDTGDPTDNKCWKRAKHFMCYIVLSRDYILANVDTTR